jgi:Cu2+-exporting ATPase
MEKKIIPVLGMACAVCSANIEKKLNSLDGINYASVSLSNRSASVEYNPKIISLNDMKAAINGIGYDLVVEQDRSVKEIEHREMVLLRRKVIISWTLAAIIMSLSMGWIHIGTKSVINQVELIITLLCLFYCGKQFYKNALVQLIHLSANMDTLVALSTFITFVFSVFNTFYGERYWSAKGIENHTYFDASVMIITFVLTGRLMEEFAKHGTASAIRDLMGLTPKTAHVISADGVTDVLLETLKIGDNIEVLPGEKIPVDGSIINGDTYIDESMISGEPTPVHKIKGSEVLAGTIVKRGKFSFRATKVGNNTALSRMIEMVKEAQCSKAPVQLIVDKIARVFVPIVLGLSVITFILWLTIGGTEVLPQAILSATSVVVISCPCAMGLATPTAVMVGIGKAAKNNILIKDAVAIEELKNVDAMVIDKTGTLTIPNKNIDFTHSDSLTFDERETLKPNAHDAIELLQRNGIDVYLMSGDNEDAAKYWANKVSVKDYRSKVLPQDKENFVKQLQKEGRHVAMVGDGINDSQALAAANVSIAMGRGTDVAIDVSQITLIGDDLRRIFEAVKISRQTVKMIHENLFWAFIYNVVCIPLAGGVMQIFGSDFKITPMLASALMACSSVSVVFNSLRLKLKK